MSAHANTATSNLWPPSAMLNEFWGAAMVLHVGDGANRNPDGVFKRKPITSEQ